MWNIRIQYCIFHQQASKSVRRHNVVKYWWSVHALLNRITRCETSNSKRRYYCVSWYINILITIPKLIKTCFQILFIRADGGGGGPGRRRMSAYPSGSCASVALGSNLSTKLDRWKEIMDTPLAPQRFRDDDTSLTCSPTQGRTLSTLKRKIYCKNHYWPLPLVLMYCSFISSVVCREWNPSPQIESH